VLDAVYGLAAARALTISRLEPVFLTLRRNRDLWTRRALPSPGERFTFGRDPVTFQYYPGRGIALQPLASFGHLNGLAHACLVSHPRYRCRPHALRRFANRMLALAADRGGFVAFEYYFAFGSGAPPWISAMTQATGAQALARSGMALQEKRYTDAARSAVHALQAAPPLGVGAGARYVMYSFAPGERILNGELQALIGLRDTAVIARSAVARHLFERGEPVARAALGAFDTGAWSLYSAGGAESTLAYHRLLTGFVAGMCRRTSIAAYCATARRFERYIREPPRVAIQMPIRPRARRTAVITFTLSKVSHVRAVVFNRHGVQLRFDARLARGAHSLRWTPPPRGRVRLRIVAIGPGGTRAALTRTVRVLRAPKAKHRPKAKHHAANACCTAT
jgi:hypothetical protein